MPVDDGDDADLSELRSGGLPEVPQAGPRRRDHDLHRVQRRRAAPTGRRPMSDLLAVAAIATLVALASMVWIKHARWGRLDDPAPHRGHAWQGDEE